MVMKTGLPALFFALALCFAGCSDIHESPVTVPPSALSGGSSRMILGAYNLILDPDGPSVDVEPIRVAAGHYDVLDYLLPPWCDKCFYADIVAYDPYANAFSLDISLRNYSMWVVYDARGVVVESTGYHIANPTGHYRIGPDGVPLPDLYGYIDLDSGLANRMYPPGLFKQYDVIICLPLGGKITKVPFVIDACYPDNCREVYYVQHTGNSGSLTQAGGSLTIKYNVRDWQDDVSWVKVNATPITGGWVSFAKTGPEKWEAVLTNSAHAAPGVYHLEMDAYSPNKQGIILYDYFEVTVQ